MEIFFINIVVVGMSVFEEVQIENIVFQTVSYYTSHIRTDENLSGSITFV